MSDDGEGAGSPLRVFEQAKSGRSTCKGKCKKMIPKGQFRFGTQVVYEEHAGYQWRCLPCITSRVAQNIIDKAAGSPLVDSISFGTVEDKFKDAFVAYVTALAAKDEAAANAQLAILGSEPTTITTAAAPKAPKAAKPKRPVEDLLASGKADGFSTLTAPELKELLKAKKDELVERVEELYAADGGGGDDEAGDK